MAFSLNFMVNECQVQGISEQAAINASKICRPHLGN